MREFEPTMRTIEDYNGNESKEHRRVVNVAIISMLFVGVVYTAIQQTYDSVSDQYPESVNLLEIKKDF